MRRPLVITVLLSATLLAGVPLALNILRYEGSVTGAERELQVTARYADDRESVAPSLDEPGDNPRVAMLRSLSVAIHASRMPPGRARDTYAARAEQWLEPAFGIRPFWGELQVTRAMTAVAREGDNSAIGLTALADSYADRPFLRDAGLWRVSYGLAAWSRLDPRTQRQVIAEAVWLGHVSPDARRAVFAAARESDGYLPLLIQGWLPRAMDAAQPSLDKAPRFP